MGYRFIFGTNDSQKKPFFTDKLGRVPISQLKPEISDLICEDSYLMPTHYDALTIDFLNPEDKVNFFDPSVTREDWQQYQFAKLLNFNPLQ